MKKKVVILGAIIIMMIGFLAFSIFKKEVFSKEYDFAVIDTTGQSNKSYIYYYNSTGKKMYEQYLNMGYMGDTFSFPQVYDGKMYTTPWGTDKKRDLSVILEIDIKTGKYSTYDTTLHSINSFAITDQYFFTVNTMNAITKIARTNRETLITDIIEFPDYHIGKIAVYNNILYAFGSDSLGTSSDILEINIETLKVQFKKSYSDHGYNLADSALLIGDDIYFAIPYMNEAASNTLKVFNIKTKEFDDIKLPEDSPSQLMKYKDSIVISHVDGVLDKGQSISIINTKTGDIKNYKLQNTPRQIYIKDNYLYSLDIIKRNICKYELGKNSIRFIHKYSIDERNSIDFYYLSGFYSY